MKSSKENAAHGAAEKSARRETVFSLATARKMLPLLQRILAEAQHLHHERARLIPEQDELDRRRRALNWPERSRRYDIRDQLEGGDRSLKEVMTELGNLGVVLMDPARGLVGFPTTVNGREAFFTWQLGEDNVNFWSFADDSTRRTIPESWAQDMPAPANKRRGKKLKRED